MHVESKLKRLHSCYKKLVGRPIKMDSLDNRILFQKAVYFMDAAGVKFDYNFSWYIRGPYASSLATDGFRIYEKHVEMKSEINKDDDRRIKDIKEEFPEITDLSKAELYSAIIHFMRLGYKDEPLISIIQNYKSWYSVDEITKAVEKIKKSHLFNI